MGFIGKRSEGDTRVTARCECGHEWTVTYRQARVRLEEPWRGRCPECRELARITYDFAARTCERDGCDHKLTTYNPGPRCFPCEEARIQAAIQAARAAAA